MKFVNACMKFFGKKPADQPLGAFVAEVKQLSAEDRVELKPLLEKELGEEIED